MPSLNAASAAEAFSELAVVQFFKNNFSFAILEALRHFLYCLSSQAFRVLESRARWLLSSRRLGRPREFMALYLVNLLGDCT